MYFVKSYYNNFLNYLKKRKFIQTPRLLHSKVFLKLHTFDKIPRIKLELTLELREIFETCCNSLKRNGIIEYITASSSSIVNVSRCLVSLLTREIQFSSPLRILGVLSTFFFYPLHRFQRGRGGSRIQFRPVKLLSLREEASVNRFEGDQYRD